MEIPPPELILFPLDISFLTMVEYFSLPPQAENCRQGHVCLSAKALRAWQVTNRFSHS
jgi:hypothetical protein